MIQSENITGTFATTLPEWKLHLSCKVLSLQQGYTTQHFFS